jgi:hypothetical protein
MICMTYLAVTERPSFPPLFYSILFCAIPYLDSTVSHCIQGQDIVVVIGMLHCNGVARWLLSGLNPLAFIDAQQKTQA